MATNKHINKIAIEELRRSCDALSSAVDNLRVKTLTFIAATFALMTYLYSGGNLFIPPELYGRIFYFIGLGATLSALVIFLMGLRPYSWQLTTEIKELKSVKEKTETDYLEYVKGEYITVFSHNSNVYENKHTSFNLGFILLVVGAATLVIIRTFPSSAPNCYNSISTTCKVVQVNKGAKK